MSFKSSHKHLTITTDCSSPLITKQSHKAECDIHNILKQYKKTGIITHITQSRALYTDLPDTTDYQQSLNTIMAANTAFDSLPSSIRDRFKNDPALFLDAVYDPARSEELRELGVLKPLSHAAQTPGVVGGADAPKAPKEKDQPPSKS